jgi:hypothetical protein
MTVFPLPDELLMLGFDDAAGKPLLPGPVLDVGLAGAVLVELVLAGRLAVEADRVVVADASPVDDPVAEAALDRIRAAARPERPHRWIQQLAKHVRAQILDRLVATGVLERAECRLLGVFHRVRYPLLNPAPETAAQFRLDAAVRHGQTPARSTAALAALLDAVDLGPTLYPDLPPATARARLAAVAAGDWADLDAPARAAVTQVAEAVRAIVSAGLDSRIWSISQSPQSK